MANHIDLKGRVAIVTGAASGLGLATALRLKQSGADVEIWDRDPKTLDAARASLGVDGGACVDVTDLSTLQNAAEAVWRRHRRIDILVNSAGIVGPYGPTAECAAEDWNRVIEINLTGVFHCCKAIIPFMAKSGYGRIINVASAGAKDAHPLMAAYVASKSGVIGFSKSLGRELAPQGIIVNCITPGIMNTPMVQASGMDEQSRQLLVAAIPVGRIAEPAEIAALIAWLSSEECSYSAAAVFDVSGGRTTS